MTSHSNNSVEEEIRSQGFSGEEADRILEMVKGYDKAFELLERKEEVSTSYSALNLAAAAQIAKNLGGALWSTTKSFEMNGKELDVFKVCPNDFNIFKEMYSLAFPKQANDERLNDEESFLKWFNDFVDDGAKQYGHKYFDNDREANRIESFTEIAALVNDAFFVSLMN